MICGKNTEKFNEEQKAVNVGTSALKALLINFLESDGDLLKMNKKFTKPLKCAVNQS